VQLLIFLAAFSIIPGAAEGEGAAATDQSFSSLYSAAARAVHSNDYPGAIVYLERAVVLSPEHIDAAQLYGALSIMLGDYDLGLPYVRKAIELGNWGNADVVANYIQGLRVSGKLSESMEISKKAIGLFPDSATIAGNAAFAFFDSRDSMAADMFMRAVRLQPANAMNWQGYIESHLRQNLFADAEAVGRVALEYHPLNTRVLYLTGHAMHLQNRIAGAFALYRRALDADAFNKEAWAGLAGVYQELGQLDEAANCYGMIANVSQNDHAFLNNYGSLLTNWNNRGEEGEVLLKKAIELYPDSLKALANLGTYYHDEGRVAEARKMLARAHTSYQSKNNGHNSLYGLRSLLILPQVPSSYAAMADERTRLVRDLRAYVAASPGQGPRETLDGVVDRTVFYIQYHGFNDREIQELIVQAYRKNIIHFEQYSELVQPSLNTLMDSVQGKSVFFSEKNPRKIKIGFVSKFFGVFEPHALLLDGVMRYLPRSKFEVFAFPVARSDGKPLAPSVVAGADSVAELSLNHADAARRVLAAGLDVLVFADTQSEPMTHFMCHQRSAPVQVSCLLCAASFYFYLKIIMSQLEASYMLLVTDVHV
jgi:tetratricopeptide (TPR) repeat protein